MLNLDNALLTSKTSLRARNVQHLFQTNVQFNTIMLNLDQVSSNSL